MNASPAGRRRQERSLALFAGRDLFLAGLLVLPAFLFNPSTVARLVQFLLFWAGALLLGKKNSTWTTLTVMLGIVAFNLFVPYGRVLAQIGPFRITQGALLGGFEKALTVEGLVMVSKAAIRADLRLPGAFGLLIGDAFRMFERLSDQRRDVDWRDPLAALDQLLLQLSADELPAPTGPTPGTPAGRLILAVAVALAWLPLLGALLWPLAGR